MTGEEAYQEVIQRLGVPTVEFLSTGLFVDVPARGTTHRQRRGVCKAVAKIAKRPFIELCGDIWKTNETSVLWRSVITIPKRRYLDILIAPLLLVSKSGPDAVSSASPVTVTGSGQKFWVVFTDREFFLSYVDLLLTNPDFRKAMRAPIYTGKLPSR